MPAKTKLEQQHWSLEDSDDLPTPEVLAQEIADDLQSDGTIHGDCQEGKGEAAGV